MLIVRKERELYLQFPFLYAYREQIVTIEI